MFHSDLIRPQVLNTKSNQALNDQFEELGLLPLLTTVVDSHGHSMDLTGDIWQFNTPTADCNYNFSSKAITNFWLEYSLKRYAIYSVQRVSPVEAYNRLRQTVLHLSKTSVWADLSVAQSLADHTEFLRAAMFQILDSLRREKQLFLFARIRAWYLWCTDYLSDLGFDSDDAYALELVRVPGNEKGIAVRTEDPEGGALSDAELILFRRALQQDKSKDYDHIRQRAACWLCLVYGRNPANYVSLRVGDLSKLEEVLPEEIWSLNIPRIKKRKAFRKAFKKEYVDPSLARILNELIESSPDVGHKEKSNKPLFLRNAPREGLLQTSMDEWAWHMTSNEFLRLLKDFVERYQIISPRTNSLLEISVRRLRYTFATNRVREGISAMDLAEALDHTDLQHVRVYFDAKSTVVERLDRAAAQAIAPKLALFCGKIADESSEASDDSFANRIRVMPEIIPANHHIRDLGKCGRKTEFCNLYPPYSCYPCDRFRPFYDSLDVHEMVFDFLIERRERLRTDPLESSRIAVQLDEVIYACADVVRQLQVKETTNGS
jgi:integrase